MKKTLHTILAGFLLISQSVLAQPTNTATILGPSSSQSPYVMPLATNGTVTSILTATDVIAGYTMCGTPDGLGAFDNGNGTFSVLMNHEFTNTAGIARAHGGTGAFISKWIINKTTLAVVSGTDLIQNVYLYNGGTYSLTPAVSFTRFCSGDLAPMSAYWNAATGLGTQARIYMNGEENGTEGRALAHIASGPATGNTYDLPYLGKQAWENSVACPNTGTKTMVGLMDDTTPGQVFMYIGTKTNTGLDIDKAGLTNGKLYGVAVTGLTAETNTSTPPANTTFSLVDLGQVNAISGASLNTMSNNLGVTTFLRPEDGAWDPSSPRDFYFNTTNAFGANSRLWRLRFTNINTPELGGTITAVLDGSEGQQMFDNLTIDNYGHILLQEDVGNNAHNGKMWQYTIATDVSTIIAQHDPNRFITGGPNFLTQDEETSGIVDAQSILGPGWFLSSDQAHYAIAGAVVEGGQLFAFYNPATALSNPEINIQGNASNIGLGSVFTTTTNNTGFGVVNIGSSLTKTYNIINAGPGALNISSVTITGANAAEFTLSAVPVTPFSVAVGQQSFSVQFTPAAAGTRSAMVTVYSNDFDESVYNFVIDGSGNIINTGINNATVNANKITLFPNPAKDEAIVKMTLDKNEHVLISVVDIQGKKVLSAIEKDVEKGEQSFNINTSTLANGEYFVRVNTGNNNHTIKMVVSH